jgi:hypothetical protein
MSGGAVVALLANVLRRGRGCASLRQVAEEKLEALLGRVDDSLLDQIIPDNGEPEGRELRESAPDTGASFH